MSSVNRVQIERQTNYEMSAKLDQTRHRKRWREGVREIDSCPLDGWIRWNVPSQSGDWRLAKELEIGHKLSGGNHIKIFAAGVGNAVA